MRMAEPDALLGTLTAIGLDRAAAERLIREKLKIIEHPPALLPLCAVIDRKS
jgi:hypothetical protein